MRAPNIYFFNPTCEMAIANNSPSFIPKQLLLNFENDLSYLPAILAQNEDLIAVSQYEDLTFINQLHQLGFPTPGQILKTDLLDPQQKIVSEISNFIPWGWSPNLISKINKVPQLEAEHIPIWGDKIREVYSRKTALVVLKDIINTSSTKQYINTSLLPQVLSNIEEVLDFISLHKKVVLKEPWSSSGKGIIFIRKRELSEGHLQRCNSILKQQGFIMGEKLLDKITDFSLHFNIDDASVAFEGESFFNTNSNGQYQATLLNSYPDIEPQFLDFIKNHKAQLIRDLTNALNKSSIKHFYKGFFGVDIMLVIHEGKPVFQPCVEINLRNNMGTIALHIQKHIHPEAKGEFKIVLDPLSKFEDIFVSKFDKLEFKDQKIIRGTFPLVDPKGKRFGAYVELY